jgi:hypothetical protein
MIKISISLCGLTCGIVERKFLPDKPGLAALAALNQHKVYAAVRPVPQKAKPLWLQTHIGCTGTELGQTFRPVNKKEITAVFESPGRGLKQRFQGAAILPPG